MDFRVAIATYKRPKGLGEKTLKTLSDNNIDKDIIDIFVNNQEEYDIYRPMYPEYNMIIGEVGMRQIRQFIVNYYEEGTKVFFMDDDIISFKEKNDNKLKNVDNLRETIENGFKLCEEHKTCLFGIYPVDNAFFMKDNHTTHLQFCVGWTFGAIIDKEALSLDTRTIGNFEDYERTIKSFKKYGKVIRLNNICAKTKYATAESGGMNIGDRSIGMKADLEILKELFSDYIYIKEKKSALIGVNPQIRRNIKNIL